MNEEIVRFLERQPKWLLLGISIGLVLLIGAIDFAIRIDLGLSVFYLLPIAIARMGGDEFVILLPQSSLDQAAVALNRTFHGLQALSQSRDWPVGFSIGAITFTTLPSSIDALIAQADRLMYEVKQSGKNRLQCQQYLAHAD